MKRPFIHQLKHPLNLMGIAYSLNPERQLTRGEEGQLRAEIRSLDSRLDDGEQPAQGHDFTGYFAAYVDGYLALEVQP